MSQQNLGLKSKATNSVECLAQTFPNEEARREHFLKLLAVKLKDAEFRKIEGFPIGKDEDILALSDPPYYTACPNPWIGDFLKAYGTAYDPKKPYHREPFAADVSEGKNHPIYNAHSYHTKVPHRAIMRYILHYTEPGEVIFDGFAGTGMTGVAAQLCGDRAEVQELGYRVRDDGTILDQEGKPFSKLGARRAILNDLSPAATFIAYNYNTPVDADAFESDAQRVLKEVEDELGWMYETTHTDGKAKGHIKYTIWSDVFRCPECAQEFVFWDVAVDQANETVHESFACPHCNANLNKKRLDRVLTSKYDAALGTTISQIKQVPVVHIYSVGKKRFQKKPDAKDLALLEKIDQTLNTRWFPKTRMPEGDESRRNDGIGLTHIHHFYTSRDIAYIAACLEKSKGLQHRSLFMLCITSLLQYSSKLCRWRTANKSGPLSGTLYVSSTIMPLDAATILPNRVKRMADGKRALPCLREGNFIVGNEHAGNLRVTPETLDYIFVDPPFGGNIMYSELSFIWEAWLNVLTNNRTEAITNGTQGKALSDYQALMFSCFKACWKALKPGRWMTVEFSNTQASVWNAIQTSLQEAGFVVANVSALDRQQLSFKAVTTTTAVKQDLVISAYKPNGGLEERFAKRGETAEGVWDFTQTHLRNLPVVKARGGLLEPIAERDPRILYDRMVAFYIGHSTPVPLSSAEFQAGLAERFPQRDEMFFLPEQVNEYDKKRQQMEGVGQLSIFVEDEKSAVAWLRNFLNARPSVYQDIQPEFMQQLGASWKKWETRPELRALLEQNFLRYEGDGEVPSQIHSYLSTHFKELRNMAKDNAQLRHKATDRWYVPDPKKNIDVEKLRNRRLLEEFWGYLPAGYSPPALSPNRGDSLPGMTVRVPKIPKGKKLKELRSEAVRVGFKHCYQAKDYQTILVVAEMLPESVLNEDEQLQMLYDTAVTRTGVAD